MVTGQSRSTSRVVSAVVAGVVALAAVALSLVVASARGATFPVPTPGSRPYHIVTGADGNLWFTELEGSKIGRITPSGTITEFALAPERYPHSLVAATDSGIWFCEQKADRIGRIGATDSAPKVVEHAVPARSRPAHIVQLGNGDLFFTQSGRGTIGRMTLGGTYLGSYPTPRQGLNGIAVGSDGAIWFEESGASRIGRLDPATGQSTDFGGLSGQPHHVARGPDGNIWFAELYAGRIGRITPTGTVTEFVVPGRGGAQSEPDTLAPGRGHRLLFTDSANSQIDSIDTGSLAITVIPLSNRSSRPVGITVGPDHRTTWFCLDSGNAIGHL
jgi:virginiamycin B lyase